MRTRFIKNAIVSLYNRNLISSPHFHLNSKTQILIPKLNFPNSFYFFSSDPQNPNPNPNDPPAADDGAPESTPEPLSDNKDDNFDIEDVSTAELKSRISQYFAGDEEALPSIMEAIIARRMTGLHEETDDELAERLKFTPLDNIADTDVESDFESAYKTDDDVPNLYSAKDIVVKRMIKEENFNMDETKWNAMMEQPHHKGKLGVSKACEDILEEMLRWDNVLPEKIKQKLQKKRKEIKMRVDNKEIEEEEGNELFKAFEDEMVAEYGKKGEEEGSIESDEVVDFDNKSDDPPGVGPILRWHSRLVLTHGGDAWHPKNRKVKLSVTVKELGLSKYQFRRMREIVGKRYHSGKDELTITSERFDHRVENKKDCLRTLINIIDEAGKATALVDEARTAYMKQRLKANPEFMARLHAQMTKAPDAIPA